LYHRFENELFDHLITRLITQATVKMILLPRSEAQRKEYETAGNLIIPRQALDGANLIAAADLVVSAGGTMNREAAALGVPAISVYAGKWAAIDEELVRDGRLLRISSRVEIDGLSTGKKSGLNARRATDVRKAVAELILD
jgi:predicted glycosyltransferase